MNKFKSTYISVLAVGALLTGCNNTGVNATEPGAISSKNMPYSLVQVYPNRMDIPKNSRIIGKVTAQNKDIYGVKASPQAILVELKRQAVLLGGNGIVNVTPGTVHTTANAVITIY